MLYKGAHLEVGSFFMFKQKIDQTIFIFMYVLPSKYQMKKYWLLLPVVILLSLVSCEKSSTTTENRNCKACELMPEVGPCNAAFVRYFYNQETKECDSFIWGGCSGVVPFESLDECKLCCN